MFSLFILEVFREAFKNRGSKFLDVEADYEDTSNLQLRLTKNSQKQIYKISEIFIMSDGKELTRLTVKTAEYYKGFVQKIDKIWFNKNEGWLLIFIDNKFTSKKGEKAITKKQKKMKLENQSLNCLNNNKYKKTSNKTGLFIFIKNF